MAQHETDNTLPSEKRMEIFQALVDAQDGGMTSPQSRQAIAQRFGLDERQVRRIEKEGLDANWPPL
jgi:hypothetical protein